MIEQANKEKEKIKMVAENVLKIKEIEKKLGKNFVLNVPGREFLKEGEALNLEIKKFGFENNVEFKKLISEKQVFNCKWAKRDQIQLFLFNDILVVTKIKSSTYQLLNIFALKNYKIEFLNDFFGDNGLKLSMKSSSKVDIKFERFYFSNENMCKEWFEAIDQIIKKKSK